MIFLIRDALKEELLAEFNAIPPIEELEKMYSFSERHVKQMETIFAELRRRERIEGCLRVIRKVAIIVIVALAVVFASVKFVPEVYAYVKEWLMEIKEDRIRFEGRSGEEKTGEVGESLRFELGYVPEGYELESEVNSKTGICRNIYKNGDGTTLNLVYCGRAAGDLLAVNSEGVLIEEININGIQYYVFASGAGKIIVTWECKEYLIRLEGLFDKAQMLDMATAVVILENK